MTKKTNIKEFDTVISDKVLKFTTSDICSYPNNSSNDQKAFAYARITDNQSTVQILINLQNSSSEFSFGIGIFVFVFKIAFYSLLSVLFICGEFMKQQKYSKRVITP